MTQILNFELYKFILIFLRIGTAIMFMPGFMSSYVNPKLRLGISLGLTIILVPVLNDHLPPPSDNFSINARMLFFEITYGIFIAIFMQILFSALNLAGNIAGQAIGFSNAQMFDPTFQTQSIVIDSFLSIIALTVVFMTDTHHLMLSAVVDSYQLFPVGSILPVADFANSLSETLSKSFMIGFKLGSPFVAFTIIFYVGMGLVSRLMPQLNIFFLSLPLQIYLGLGLLFITIPAIIMWFMQYFETGLEQFVR